MLLQSTRDHTRLGILFMVTGILLFSVNDALGKWLVMSYAVAPLLLVRGTTSFLLIAPLMWRQGSAPLRQAPRPALQLLRVLFAIVDIACFYWAVRSMPLADVITYYLAGPIYVAAMAALFLGERIDARQWLAIAAGFAGVVIALRPTSGAFSWPALIALVGSLSFGLLMITTRFLRGTSDTVLIAGQTFGTILAGLVALPLGWATPALRDIGLMALLGVVGTTAQFCLIRSLKLAPASVVVPYQYMMIVWAVVFGYLLFGDTPNLAMLVGATIIIAAGLYIFVREQGRRGEAEPLPPPP
jgi:drug/metabolite transporter (DMT)-like permease